MILQVTQVAIHNFGASPHKCVRPDAVSVGVYDVTPLKSVRVLMSFCELHPFLVGKTLTG